MPEPVRRADDRSIDVYAEYLTEHGTTPDKRLRLSSAGTVRLIAGQYTDGLPAIQTGGLRFAFGFGDENVYDAEPQHNHWVEDMQRNAPECPECGRPMQFDDSSPGDEPDYICEKDGRYSEMMRPSDDYSENGFDSRLSDSASAGIMASARSRFVRVDS